MAIKTIVENRLVDYALIGGGLIIVGFLAYEFVIKNFIKSAEQLGNGLTDLTSTNPATQLKGAYLTETSTPISQAGSSAIISTVANNVSSNYQNAQIQYTAQPISASQLIQSTTPIINVSESGISTYNPNASLVQSGVSASSTITGTGGSIGTFQNPYNYNNGWQGAGVYSFVNSSGGTQIATFYDWLHYITKTPQ